MTGTTYDAVGNPTTYNGFAMTWSGRQLKSMVKNGGQYSYSFTYNDEGIRTSKTSQGVKHTYILEGSRIVGEQFGVHYLLYLYDESGAPVGLQYRKTSYAAGVFDTYYFEKNVFGDIVGVYAEDGTKVGTYKYDAWGNCTRVANSGATTAQKQIFNTYNPFRYRGYYYDVETALYYLQSRYYDPATGRFINADGYVSTGTGLLGYNMYAYCNNNPVMRIDTTGRGWVGAIVGGACGAVIGGLFGALSAITSGGNVAAGIVVGMLNGAVCGAIGGSIAEDIATCGLSSVGTATMLLAAGGCFAAGVASDVVLQCVNSQPQDINEIDIRSALRSGTQNVVITALSITPAALGPIGLAGDIVVNSVYNLIASTGQWMYNTVEDSQRNTKSNTPENEVIPID